MRNKIEGVYTIEYPESICWLKDNNVIRIRSSYGAFSAEITIQGPSILLQDTIKLTNSTPLNELLFDLNESLRYLYKNNIEYGSFTFSIALDGGTFQNYFSFVCKVFDGISFASQTHGSSDIIYIYNDTDLSNLCIYSPANGEAVFDSSTFSIIEGVNELNLSALITDYGEYNLCLRSALNFPPIAEVTGDLFINPTSSIIYFTAEEQSDPGTLNGGYLYNRKQIFPKCYKIIYNEPCADYPFAYLRYINSDGCYRYIGGKVISMNDNSKLNNYFKPNTLIYNTASEYQIDESGKVITIGVQDVEQGTELEDIIYSSKLWIKDINDQWVNCQLNNTNLTTNFRDDDVELEIIIHKK